MNICVVTVTYGNRFHILEKVLNSLVQEDIKEIIVIDNGSSQESKNALNFFISKSSLPIQVVLMGKNTGSAKGFKTGLEKALQTSCEYIWVLDDDNLPLSNTLSVLKKYWIELVKPESYASTALLSNRIDRQNFLKALRTQNPNDILQKENNFMGFHWGEMWEKVYERVMKRNPNENVKLEDLPAYTKVAAAPYGGLFMHRKLLEKFELPPEEYVLYMDDFAFTLPITRNGGSLYLIKDSILEDVERSVYLPKSKKWLHHTLFESKETVAYYALRNMLFFTMKYLKKNSFIFNIHRISFYIFITFMAILRGELRRIKLLKKAIRDAEKGHLGMDESYVL
ncbi:MAG: glycosyltransferase [Raineya sp.]|jgi:GT2 family glycosyltransferase|nr:glycosyltransferase [Raineya sp.]